MEREYEVTGVNPVLVRGEYREPGEKFNAIPEEVVFYVHIGAVSPTSGEAVFASDPDLVKQVMADAKRRRRGVDSVPVVQLPVAQRRG